MRQEGLSARLRSPPDTCHRRLAEPACPTARMPRDLRPVIAVPSEPILSSMTSTDETTPTPEGAPPRRWPMRWLLIAVPVIAIAVGAGIAVALASGDEPDTATDRAQLAALQQGCQDWMNDRGPFAGSDATWCANMAGW